MTTVTFTEVSRGLREAMKQLEIPEPYSGFLIDVYRGPFSNSDALATMWEYYDMVPGSTSTWTFDDVTRKMQQSAADWSAAHKAAGEMEKYIGDPSRAALVADVGRSMQWERLVAEFDHGLKLKDDLSARAIATVNKAVQSARDGGLLKPLTEATLLARKAAEKNAEVFRSLTPDGGKRPPASVAYGYGAHAGFWGGVAAAGVGVCKATGAAGAIGAVGLGAAIAGTGLCIYGLYRVKRAYFDDDF